MNTPEDTHARIVALEREIYRLRKVNTVLMNRVEKSMDLQGDAFSLFESNILLQKTVDVQTRELKREIHERKTAGKLLRESLQKLSLHIQYTPVGVIEWDPDFRVVEWNAAAENMFGYTKQEALGQSALDLVVKPSEREKIANLYKDLLTRQGGIRSVDECVCKDGSHIVCDWYNTTLINGEGTVIGVASLVQNITIRVNADREKRERLERAQKQRFAVSRMTTDEIITCADFASAVRMMLEIVADAIDVQRVSVWQFDKNNTVLSCVDLYESSSHRHSSGAVLHRSDYPEYFEAIIKDRVVVADDALIDPRTKAFGDTYLIPNGITSMLDITFRISGAPLGIVCIEHTGDTRKWHTDEIAFADEISSLLSQVYLNSEKKRTEEQKRELQERLDRAKHMESLGLLAGGVAHDLNNILGPVVGYTDLILMQMDEDNTLTDRIRRIGKSAQEAADVIQDLLTLARRGRYELMPCDLNRIIHDFMESPTFLSLTEQKPHIKITANLDDSIGTINGSPPHLLKLIMNLTVNAFDAIANEGEIYIATSCRDIDALSNGYSLEENAGTYVCFSIADTGTGIPPEALDKIFEPYFSRKKMSTSSGSGLGLSVVYGVIKDHNGYYDIISSVDNGTVFKTYLPIPEEEKKAAKKEDTEITGSETILVVDDNEGQREVAIALIKSLGYTVCAVESGEAAIEYLRDHHVDLVMLDMIMPPGIDGLETYSEIIKIHPGQKALISTGFSATDRVRMMQELGAGQYLRKPFTLNALGRAIREELARTPDTSPA